MFKINATNATNTTIAVCNDVFRNQHMLLLYYQHRLIAIEGRKSVRASSHILPIALRFVRKRPSEFFLSNAHILA